jgi:hypothetical protein
MALEIDVQMVLRAFKPSVMGAPIGMQVPDTQINMIGQFFIGPTTISVANTPMAIPLGQVSSPGWSFWLNVDPSTYIQFFNGASGAVFMTLYPGQPACLPLDQNCTPFACANPTGNLAANLQYMVLSF